MLPGNSMMFPCMIFSKLSTFMSHGLQYPVGYMKWVISVRLLNKSHTSLQKTNTNDFNGLLPIVSGQKSNGKRLFDLMRCCYRWDILPDENG